MKQETKEKFKKRERIFIGIVIALILILSIWITVLYLNSIEKETVSKYYLDYNECKTLCKNSGKDCYCSDLLAGSSNKIYSCKESKCKEVDLDE